MLLYGAVKSGVTEHVAYYHLGAVFLSHLAETVHFLLVYGKGLFEKKVVALFEDGNSGIDVQPIHGTVYYHVGKFLTLAEGVDVIEAVLLGNTEAVLHIFPALGVGVDDSHDLKLFGKGEGDRCVNVSTVACSYQNCGYLLIHNENSFFLLTFTDFYFIIFTDK